MAVGRVAAICFIVAISAVMLLGYFANVEDVTTQRTDYDYVTDVSGAYDGQRGQLDLDYSPSANLTGWSTKQADNNLYLSGVDTVYQTQANQYYVYKGLPSYTEISATLTADQTGGRDFMDTATLTWTADGTEHTASVGSDGTGLFNGEAITAVYTGKSVNYGSFGVKLSDLMAAFGHTGTVMVAVQKHADGYPCVLYSASDDSSVQTIDVGHGSHRYVINAWRGDGSDVTTTWTSSTEMVSGDGGASAASAAWLFWGRAQYNDRGDSVPSVSLSFYVGSTPDAGYMDPAAGVVPKSVALDPTYQTVHKTVTSKIVTEFSWADMEKTAIGSHYASIPLYVLGGDGSKYYAGTIEAYYENGDYLYKWTDASGAVTNFLGADHDKSTLVFTCENGGLTMVWKHDTTTWHKLDTGPADYSAVWTTAEPDKYITIKSTVEGQTTTWGDLS